MMSRESSSALFVTTYKTNYYIIRGHFNCFYIFTTYVKNKNKNSMYKNEKKKVKIGYEFDSITN